MKYLLFLFLTLGVSGSEGNLNRYLELMQSKGINWSTTECAYPAKEAFLAYYDTKLNLKSCNFSERQGILYDNFHLIDLNQDGLLDIVYEGGCPNYEQVILYLNKGNELVVAANIGGKIIRFNQTDEKTELVVRMDACCCIDNNRLSWHEIPTNGFETQLIGELYWHHTFELPERNILYEDLAAPNVFTLRYEPEINNELKKHSCHDGKVQGNWLGEFAEGTDLRLWTVKRDEAGDTWALVTINQDQKRLEGNAYAQPYQPDKTNFMGWVEGKALGLRP